MLMPAFLPSELMYLSSFEEDEPLFQKVKENSYLFNAFFMAAIEDEGWIIRHEEFIHLALEWVTEQFAADRLPFQLSKNIGEKIRQHFSSLELNIPLDLSCQVGESRLEFNSLLFGTASDFLHDFFLKKCLGKKRPLEIVLRGIEWDILITLSEWMKFGDIPSLWKKEEKFLWSVLKQASTWEMTAVVEITQEILKRYLNRANVFDHLVLTHEQKWHFLKYACCKVINELGGGMTVFEQGENGLGFEFLEFNAHSLGVFDRLQKWITHLAFSLSLTEEMAFSETMQKCPKLIGLDISRTRIFTERLYDIPSHLQELDISMCVWLTPANLRKIIEICPRLVRLNLSSNGQITAAGWAELHRLQFLEFLGISRCHQISDDDLKLILKACLNLTELRLEECEKLTDRGFFNLALNIPKIVGLSLARCGIGDTSLIEIGTRCIFLQRLDLTRCENITDKGVIEMVCQTKTLRELVLTHCSISPEAIIEIRKLKPLLKVKE
ncbi:hypothetical protein [Parachlamydia sp. AcF125]|uniref:hypothetical protein n=1 Tax=Parachlamydia sp. AcF125 TaxID=2795736 RepID=UPI001BC9A484|nr:hypothetical protein [Parachlamydia sp. AcF125]MBS4169073.1 hypothetical protein [Parachlamydia sp. AcF125]